MVIYFRLNFGQALLEDPRFRSSHHRFSKKELVEQIGFEFSFTVRQSEDITNTAASKSPYHVPTIKG